MHFDGVVLRLCYIFEIPWTIGKNLDKMKMKTGKSEGACCLFLECFGMPA